MNINHKLISVAVALLSVVLMQSSNKAYGETSFFPTNSFGVAGPIPTPGNLGDLVGPPDAGTAVRFDPGDLGFLAFETDITGISTGAPNTNLIFNIISAIPSSTGEVFLSFLLGNIGAGPSFVRAPTAGLVAPNGADSIFQFVEAPSTGVFTVDTSAFLAGCASIGGCNSIVIGTSGLGAAGGGSFVDGGTLTFSSVIAASPEPSTWAFMIIGFMVLAFKAKQERLKGREKNISQIKGRQKVHALYQSVAA